MESTPLGPCMPRHIFPLHIPHTRRNILKFQFIQVYSLWRYPSPPSPALFLPASLPCVSFSIDYYRCDIMISMASSTRPLCHTNLVETLQRSETQRQSLRSASYAHKPRDWAAGALLFYAQVGQSVLAWIMLAECL